MDIVSGNGKKSRSLDARTRSSVARIVFNNCEAIGISDRAQIEEITTEVIEHLEAPHPQEAPALPGMEALVVRVEGKGKGSLS
ncbi:MAG: hypothetical protein ABH834_02660, partial [Candidatus Altiarchaeota archaeon]